MKKLYLLSPKFSDYIGGMETHAIEFSKYFSVHEEFKLEKIFSKTFVDDGISSEKKIIQTKNGFVEVDGFEVRNILTGDFVADAEKLKLEIEPNSILFLNSPTWLPVVKIIKDELNLLVLVRSGGNDIPAGWVGNERSKVKTLEDSRSYLVSLINNYVDVLICNSNFSKQSALKYGVNENKILIITGGVDTTRFKEGSHKKPLEILTTSRFVDFKGIEYSLNAIAKLKTLTSIPFTYSLVGSGPKRDELLKLIEDLKIQDIVSVKGPVDINLIHKEYAKASLFLHLPILEERFERDGSYIHTETMGRIICEAMSSGLPIVASNVGGIPEVMFDKKNGFLVSERDFELAAKLLKNLLEDESLRFTFSDFGRKIAEEKYGWSILFAKYLSIFRGEKIEHSLRCIEIRETV